MAKKTAEKKPVTKKPRRRLKRTARRSLAAVLMITAVVVAAIPVPENIAAPEGGIAVHAETGVPEPATYQYPTEDMNKAKLCVDSQLKKPSSDTTDYRAHIVSQLSDGLYQMDWQFKFYFINEAGEDRGIISEYNSTYQQDEVELNPNVIYKYDTIEQTDVSDFFADDTNNVKYECKVPNLENEADQFLNEYFKSSYEDYVKIYNDWKTAHDKWLSTPVTQDPGPEPQRDPESLVKYVRDLSDNDRLKYYCDVNVSPNQHTGANSLRGCRLVEVIDSSQKDPGGANHRIYIPQKIDGQDPSGHFDKQLGLRYISDASIIGIGDEAFKDKENVNKLIIPKEMKYIGQSAFEHSFIKEVAFYNVKEVGDRAFKNCTQLTKIDFGAAPTTVKLGVECFYGTGLTEVVFPQTIDTVGPGAFAYCEAIQKLDFSKITARPAVIDAYAFYNTRALNEVNFIQVGTKDVTVNIDTIGTGAFAVFDGETGNLSEFTFPSKVSTEIGDMDISTLCLSAGMGMGDCVLAGRTNLKKVVMPADFGRGAKATIPNNLLYNCYNLELLQFPDDGNGSCGLATYQAQPVLNTDGSIKTPGLFSSISNENFIVQGPELDRTRSVATPRKTTWDAKTTVSDVVPYLYIRNGLEYYEVSDGFYLLCVDNKGVLTSCTLKPGADVTGWDGYLEIPAMVGKTKVTGIATNCFTDPELNNNVKTLKIADNSISVINASVFKGWEKLKKAYIGNSVTEIGASAFEGCNKLEDVTFSSPSAGHDAFKIGADAFKTGSTELTFHGDIVEGYAPFAWAMDKNNIIKEPEGIRVCYQSLSPTFLTVMYDENTELVTLLDYPKMSQVSSLLNEAYATDITPYGSYEHMREEQSYNEYRSTAFDSRRDEFKTAWMVSGEAAYDSENYGPWITPEFCAQAVGWGTTEPGTPDSGTSDDSTSSDSTGGDESEDGTAAAIADFFFEPITVYAADMPQPYYTRNPFKIGETGTGYPQLNAEEISLLDAVHNITVPEGVDSIDVYGYINNSERNKNNAAIYLERKLDPDVWRMYTSRTRHDENSTIDTKPGLFSGYYQDYESANDGEKYKRGNDQIQSVDLKSVKYLPDYAFDSCENLLSVNLGPECSDIGIAPFRGCYEMETVGDNEWYTTTNGIIYSKNTDGSLTIEECLSARGRKIDKVGPPIVNAGDNGDANLKSVSAIKPGAFEDCDYLTEINFGSNNTAGLKVIPEDCFKNSDSLQTVVLPITVNDIGRGAFVGANRLSALTIYGSEVKISGSAFDSDKDVQTTVSAPDDSAVVRYVKEYGTEYKLVMDNKPFGKQWKVSFYDANYKLLENLTDDLGNPIDNPQYVTDGDQAQFPDDPVMEGWTFEEWIGLNGATRRSPIHEDTIFYAQGHYDSGAPVDGKYVVEFLDGVDGQQLAGRGSNPIDGKYYVPIGESFADQGWPEPIHPVHEGYEAAGFSSGNGSAGQWTADTVVNSNLSIIALYKVSTTSGGSTNTPGGNTNTSGNTTNTSGNTTNNNNSSSSRSTSSTTTSSSTSSSSTSTSSSTSDGAGKYAVFVENGSGSGYFSPGETVIIQAATPAAGMKFSNWTTDSNGVTLASASMAATTFTMPSNNVTVKANFVEDTGTTSAPRATSTGNTTDSDTGNTRVDIEKPGISNRDLATANVNGSTDNFIVKISETDEATRAVAAALTNKYGTLDNILYYAMDITLWDATGSYQLTGDQLNGISVDITIPIPDSLVAYGGNNKAGAVINSDQLESLNENFTTINGVPCIRFRATHFSPYTIYVDTGNLVEGMLDTTPKTGDPIHPKWFLSLGLACLSIILFMKKDKRVAAKATVKA